MVFSSTVFTFYFLPAVIILYYLAKDTFKNYILLAASLLFYAYGEPKFVFVMLASIGLNYLLALRIAARRSSDPKGVKALLILDVFLNIGLLFVCKYLDFSIAIINSLLKTRLRSAGIPLPIGISFFTFQALSYVIDVYKGTAGVQKSVLNTALYISFFPQLVAGPIVRYSSIEKQLAERKHSLAGFGDGAERFMLGFCKKVILANNLASAAEDVFALNPSTSAPLLLWIGSLCYSLQIFFDFSGYSDMAIGLGKLFGFEFEENFLYPYVSGSVTEFWRRWHISLSRWFRDYVYIPLGGSRVPVPRQILNLFIVWMLTGIWHGANFTFIFWGLGYFVLLVLEKYVIRPDARTGTAFRIFWRVITLVCVNFFWVIFNSETLRRGLRYCFGMLGFYIRNFAPDPSVVRLIREYGIFMLLGVIFSTPVMAVLKEKAAKTRLAPVQRILTPVLYALMFVWAVSFLILGAHNPFIYFNF